MARVDFPETNDMDKKLIQLYRTHYAFTKDLECARNMKDEDDVRWLSRMLHINSSQIFVYQLGYCPMYMKKNLTERA